MANVVQTTQNNTEPLVLASDNKARDDFTIASGVFVKGEVVSISGKAIAKYVPASNVPNGVLLADQDATVALTNVTALIKGEVDETQLTYDVTDDIETANAIYGPALTTRQCLELVGIYAVDTRAVMAQQS